jgi:toxin ParE1/3/4
MARKISISFADSVVEDLDDILNYYIEQDSSDVGEKLVSRIISQIQTLSRHPDMGRIVPEFGVKNLKELIRPPFRIVYRRDPRRVRIVRVWRSERLLKLP